MGPSITEGETAVSDVRRRTSVIRGIWNEILMQVINSWLNDVKNLEGYSGFSSTLRGWALPHGTNSDLHIQEKANSCLDTSTPWVFYGIPVL